MNTAAHIGHNSPEVLRELIEYYPDTGLLKWKRRGLHHFSTQRACNVWNGRYAEKAALNCDDGRGYRQGRVFRRSIFAHRAAWAIHYGKYPVGQIDHINGIKSDNRIDNLRIASSIENARNFPMNKRNVSGQMGVHFAKRFKKFMAYINDDSGRRHLGYFHDIDEAIKARKAAEVQFSYHKNHGRAS